jgi:hypothetical protein
MAVAATPWLQSAASSVGNARWRTVVLAVLALFIIQMVVFHDDLRSAYETHIQPAMPSAATPTTTTKPAAYNPDRTVPDNEPPLWTPSVPIKKWEDGDTKGSVAICIAVKDQYPDLREWLTHHYHHLGIRHFYIMDDGSVPPLASRNYSDVVDKRAITHRYYIPEVRTQYMQMQVYDECVRLYGKRHDWIGFFDADEFLQVINPAETIQSILAEYTKNATVGAFAVNWLIHNSNGLVQRPVSSRKAFTSCIVDSDPHATNHTGLENDHVKVFLKPSALSRIGGPHSMVLKAPAVTIGEHGDLCDRWAWRVPSTRDRVALHHYGVKSKEQYEEKMGRGNAMTDPKGWAWWDTVEGMDRYECTELAELEP